MEEEVYQIRSIEEIKKTSFRAHKEEIREKCGVVIIGVLSKFCCKILQYFKAH